MQDDFRHDIIHEALQIPPSKLLPRPTLLPQGCCTLLYLQLSGKLISMTSHAAQPGTVASCIAWHVITNVAMFAD